jgi:hypothetical protein
MPIEITHDFERDLTIHVVTGRATEEDMFGALEAFYASKFTRLLLWDMSETDLRQVQIEVLQRFVRRAAELGARRAGGKTAVVAATALQYGMARMSEAFAEIESTPYEFRAFKSREAALAWLLAN